MGAPRFFTRDYVEHAALRDGTRVVLRLIRPEDKELLRAGFERLSPASRYSRFLAPKAALSDDELRYLCDVDQEDHVAIGAVREDDPVVGLGTARFIRQADRPDTAEAAIAVTDEAQHRGLGSLLGGVTRFRCEILGSNASMTGLLDQIAPDRTVELGSGVMSVELELPEVSPTQLPDGWPRETALYRLLRATAQNAVEWTEAVRRLWRR